MGWDGTLHFLIRPAPSDHVGCRGHHCEDAVATASHTHTNTHHQGMHTQSILRNAVPNLEGNQLVTGALWFVGLLTMSGELRDTTAPGVHFGTKRTLSVLAFVLLYMPLYYPLNPTQYAREGDSRDSGG